MVMYEVEFHKNLEVNTEAGAPAYTQVLRGKWLVSSELQTN